MKQKVFWLAAVAALTMTIAACGSKESKQTDDNEAISTKQNLPGDSTVYGLACDGCNDTILVFLPRYGGDPDTFNILGASKAQKVFGRPKIGDKMAVVVNHNNPKVADMVIDLEELKGEWCYVVKPQLRRRADLSQEAQQRFLKEAPDSLISELMQPREYGVEIKSENTARPIGFVHAMTSDEESPVVYPQLKRYREWHIFNGLLVLSETKRDTTGVQTVINSDTAQFVLLRRDTLVLRFEDGEQGYYRKRKSEE
jgi:hypothetical protein